MRSIPAGLAARLEGAATRLAHAFVLTRRDGTVLGFTDHDRAIAIGAVLCEPGTGFDRSAAVAHAGLAVGDEEVEGALSSDRITAADIAAGLYDGAEVEVYLVAWEAPTDRLLLRRGRLGEIVTADGAFRAEIRGPAQALDRVTGRIYGPACDAELGDGRCTVALAAHTHATTVSAVLDATRLRVAGLAGFAVGWFAAGRLTVTDGPLAGATARIDDHIRDGGGTILSLRLPLGGILAAGAGIEVVAGCDKRADTCRGKFANIENFRGFPHMPGRDVAYAYARGGGQNDGSAVRR